MRKKEIGEMLRREHRGSLCGEVLAGIMFVLCVAVVLFLPDL